MIQFGPVISQYLVTLMITKCLKRWLIFLLWSIRLRSSVTVPMTLSSSLCFLPGTELTAPHLTHA